ncbi:MAG: metallophosphoesterase [Solobacterium sp.]|nr:metallophosphoesterase [Solobacterium sp.]
MIYITGDFHGYLDGARLEPAQFDYEGLTRNDKMINVGDFGFIWYGDKRDEEQMEWLRKLPITLLFIDGNHENFVALKEYPEEVWCGGRVHRIADNILHLMRGQVYDIDGKRFFTFGGGKSIDKARRTEGVSWWPEEMPSVAECEEAIKNLDQVEWNVDYVLTHAAPNNVIPRIAPYIGSDMLNQFLETIDQELRYKHWYFGHYHAERDLDAKHTLLYHSFVEVGKTLQEKEVFRIKHEL